VLPNRRGKGRNADAGLALRRHGNGTDAPARRPPAPQDEVALVSRVAQGDGAAFDALFRRYAPRLIRFLGPTTRGAHLIDEIVNDTMFVVWRKARTFNGCSKVSTWILGIASRRRLKTLQRVDDRIGNVDIDELAAPVECGPEGQFIRQDLQRRLRDAIDALPAEQRRVVMLTYFDGCTYAEIAAIVGCPVNTVKTRMFHARRRLRVLLDDGRRAA
jgi:RNA polymerase sigma factor (sigma-70 family)